MKQLEKRFYSRNEIAEITGYSVSDSKHFKRNITQKLDNWGYTYTYEKKGITITAIPETPEAKVNEIMVREYKLSLLQDKYHFACFIWMFLNYENFNCMPWKVRKHLLKEVFQIDVAEITLKRWYKKIEKNNLLVKDTNNYSYWYTKETKNEVIRKRVETAEEQENKSFYYSEKKRLIEIEGLTYQEAMKKLWWEYHIIYYRCNEISLNACGNSASLLFDLITEWIDK